MAEPFVARRVSAPERNHGGVARRVPSAAGGQAASVSRRCMESRKRQLRDDVFAQIASEFVPVEEFDK